MRYDTGQFGAFDGLDNRKSIMHLFVLMGKNLPESRARARRAAFLRSLVSTSQSGFARALPQITPCSPAEAYALFVAITGVLGVDITRAARQLEEAVRRQ